MSYHIDDNSDGEPSPEPSPEPVVAVPRAGSAAVGLHSCGTTSNSYETVEAGLPHEAPALAGVDDAAMEVASPTAIPTEAAQGARSGSRGSFDAMPVAEAFGIGEGVGYYSKTHNVWLPATVLGHNFRDGVLESYDLNIKRGALAHRIVSRPVDHRLAVITEPGHR